MTITVLDLYNLKLDPNNRPLPPDAVPQANGAFIRCPVTFSYIDPFTYQLDTYTLPFEPWVSVQGRNIIIRNHVHKGRENGTVKEMWTADDYSIEIKGTLNNKDDDERMPEEAINRIRKFCELRAAIEVSNPLLSMFGIQYMVIEDYDFPHTPGYANQTYTIKGYSDKPFELF